MAIYRGKKRHEASALPHHETQQRPNDGASNPKPTLRPGSGGGIVLLNRNRNRLASPAATRRRARTRAAIMLALLLATVAGSFFLSYRVAMENFKLNVPEMLGEQPKTPTKLQLNNNEATNSQETKERPSSRLNHDKCAFRSYPSNRLYGLSSESQPNFLSDAAYIRGQWPIIINPNENDNKILAAGGKSIQQTPPVKVCFDTTSWEDLVDKDGNERLPFTDGHNPSVISLAPNPYAVPAGAGDGHTRLDPAHLEAIASAFPSAPVESLFLGVTIFGGGQCKFGLTPKDVDDYRFSLHEEPQGGKRAVVAVLAPPDGDPNGDPSPFRTLGQTTLLLERDVKYGAFRKRSIPAEKSGSGFARIHQEFDDPRFFFHLGRIWILYRNGPLFGYDNQIHNPVHFDKLPSGEDAGDAKFVAYVKASETIRVGGGRNIALISEEPTGKNRNGHVEWVSSSKLKALTWVDPVTVIDDVDLGDVEEKLNNRRLLEVSNASEGGVEHDVASIITSFHPSSSDHSTSDFHPSKQHRRLGSKPNKSHIHGTNGYMVPLQSTGELLGIAHFHRPENRKASDFALHGHHYTHALFTIARQAGDTTKPFKLKRLSNEFVFRANSVPAGEMKPPRDGDVIQFASGIDVVGSDVDGQLVISYGINDCEGSVFALAMEVVQGMLIEVVPGQEVVDLMEYIHR